MQPHDVHVPPQPEGAVWCNYNPLHPVFWDLAPHNVHTYVYRDIETALIATRYWTDRIVAQRPPEIAKALRALPITVFFRGQSEFTHRLLPTRLRGPKREVPPRMRVPLTISETTTIGFSGKPQVVMIPNRVYSAPADVIDEVRRVQGSWAEHDPTLRDVDEAMKLLKLNKVNDFDHRERIAIDAAAKRFPAIAALDTFRRRAAVRHYAGVPSGLMDVSSDIEVAAYFATGAGERPVRDTFGMLWAIDLGMLFRFFHLSIREISGGYEILLEDSRVGWGDNAKFFEEQGIPRLSARLISVELPLPRPIAQKAFFLELQGRDGEHLAPRDELIWWSLFERWAYPNGFVQSGNCYENANAGISSAVLLPTDDPYLMLGKH